MSALRCVTHRQRRFDDGWPEQDSLPAGRDRLLLAPVNRAFRAAAKTLTERVVVSDYPGDCGSGFGWVHLIQWTV